jgi:type II secretory pathway component HofQ
MRSWTKTTLVLAAVFVLPPLLASQAAGQAPTPSAPRPGTCYERLPTDPINLSLRDASTQSTLRLLAQNYKVNMVVTDDVTGTVTLDFFRAPVRDVFQAILDASSLVCVRQGDLLRVSTADRLVKDEKGRADAQVLGATRDLEVSKRIADIQKQAADAAIQTAASEVQRKQADLLAKRGDIKQEIIRLKYADAGVIAKTVAAMVGIGPNVTVSPCRIRKQDDKIAVEAVDPQGGGGTSLTAEQERSVVNLARATNPYAPYQGQTQPGSAAQPPGTSGYVGPPGGLGALPPFSALFGPQPPAPVVTPEFQPGGTGFSILTSSENTPVVRTDCPTNSLVLRLYDDQLTRVREALDRQLDLTPHQIKIESRIENLNRDDLFAMGVQWGGGGLLGVNSRTVVVGRGFTSNQTSTTGIGTSGIGSNQINPNLSLGSVIPVDPATGLGTAGNLVNLPIGTLLESTVPAGGGGIAFGIVGSRMNLNLALEALKTQDRSQTLARPEAVVAENQKALMSLGEQIPYATVSAAGTQVQFKDALLQLEVIPTVICRDEVQGAKNGGFYKLKMAVLVTNNSRGPTVNFGTALGTPPAIDTQKVQTEMAMVEGQRLVIGGVHRTINRIQDRKVPLFGDIPVLGWLFKQKATDDAKRELVIFLTPTVISTEAPALTPACSASAPTRAMAK